MASILLLGLESDLSEPLERILRYDRHDTQIADSLQQIVRSRNADVLFLSGDMPGYREIVTKLRTLRPALRTIVTNRIPDNRLWLDALEAGASDYCGAPFEIVQVRWLLDAALRHPVNTAA